MPKKPNAADAADLKKLVDELGSIEKEIAPLKGKIARAEQLRKTIREKVADSVPQIDAEKFVAVLGERGLRTHVDFKELVKRIGAVKFASFATAPLETLYQNVAAGHLAFCISQDQTGTRSLKVIERGVTA